MPLRLDANLLTWTIEHLIAHGDTDIFPYPPEFAFYRDCKLEIAQELSRLDLQQYKPRSAIEALTPKNRHAFRIAHQIYLYDAVILTACTLAIAPDIEAIRPPISSNIAGAYRLATDDGHSIFAKHQRFRDWLRNCWAKATFGEESHIVRTDISDFYSRVYHHRIENILSQCTRNSPYARSIVQTLKHLRAKQSFGLPVGGNAARILAEAALTDIDNELIAEGYDHSRYVDDFVIFLKDNQTPEAALAFLAKNLAINEGLSLNSSKTKVQTRSEFIDSLDVRSTETEEEAEESATEELFLRLYDAEEVDETILAELGARDLVNDLNSALAEDSLDASRIRLLLRALRLTKSPEAPAFVRANFKKLLPFAKDMVLLIDQLHKDGDRTFENFGDELVAIILESSLQSLEVSRSWLLELFVRKAVEIRPTHVRQMATLNTTLDLRQLYQLRFLLGDVNFFRMQKTRIDELSDWLKPVFIYSARCLPNDEYETWVNGIRDRVSFPLARLFCEWVLRPTINTRP